jgi:hypothetical protein
LRLSFEMPLIASGLTVLWLLIWPGAAQTVNRPALTIRVWNLARVSSSVLQPAVAIDRKAFRQAGVETAWLIDNFEPNSGVDLAVDIVRARPALPLNRDTLGWVYWNRQGEALPWADIFFRDISELANTRTETATLLANVIAHELGHMLLGPKHADTGLMQSNWGARTIGVALRQPLRIEPNEASRLRLAAARIATGPGVGGSGAHILIPAATAIPFPKQLNPALAAAVLLQGLTAYILLDWAELRDGDAVLISEVSPCSSRSSEARRVIGLASESKFDVVKSLGADHVFDYGKPGWAAEASLVRPQGVNIYPDSAGDLATEAFPLLTQFGR